MTEHNPYVTKLLILDFDGTMTDAEQEGAPFRQGYLEDIATLTGVDHERILELARNIEAEVAASPQEHGWMYGGRIVAPATVDPYLRIMPVARRIFEQLGVQMDEALRGRLLEGLLFKYNYLKTANVPREGAKEALLALRDAPVYIVTNSHTEAVQNKVRALSAQTETGHALDWLVERVKGSARKYIIDEQFTAVAESMTLPELSRPVLLRRRHYYEVLDSLRRNHKAEWADVTVVGDIFELDLALPLALGAKVGLLVNGFTPSWEKAYLANHPRAALLTRVAEIPAFAA